MTKGKKKKEKSVKFTGIFIPAEISTNRKESGLEKFIQSDVGYFMSTGREYRFNNPQIAAKWGVTRKAVFNAIGRLKSSGKIIVTGKDEYHRRLTLSSAISALFDKQSSAKIAPDEQPQNGKKSYPESSDEFRLAKLLLDEIRKRKPDFRIPNVQSWAKQIDLMMRRDNRDPARIAQVILWIQTDSGNGRWQGWQNNILSTKKLREKFDKLEMSMENNQNGSHKISKEYAGSISRDFAGSSKIGTTVAM